MSIGVKGKDETDFFFFFFFPVFSEGFDYSDNPPLDGSRRQTVAAGHIQLPGRYVCVCCGQSATRINHALMSLLGSWNLNLVITFSTTNEQVRLDYTAIAKIKW